MACSYASHRQLYTLSALICGFILAVAIRVTVGGVSSPAVAQSATAGLAFAACLVLLSAAKLPVTILSRKTIALGIAGGILLCLPSVIALLLGSEQHRPAGAYWQWALVVTVVAMAEELFLRGTLFAAVSQWRGDAVAVLVTALLFAFLHVPLYGWHVLALDLVVGVWLGWLRVLSRTYITPGFAHITADLLGWWLR